MDQDTLVSEQIESGRRLVAALAAAGFEVRIAFWAKPNEEGKWFLYLAFSVVDDEGPLSAYRIVHDVLRKKPDVWIDPLEVRVVGLNDSLTEAVLAVTKPEAPNSPFAVRNRRPYPAMIRFGGTTLAGVGMDGVCIYPPWQPVSTA